MAKIITLTIIRNEEGRFLDEWLDNISSYSDYIVIVDDASTDNTPDVIEKRLKGTNYSLHRLKESLFKQDELKLRAILWEECRKIADEGDTIIVVDSDEMMCKEIQTMKKVLANIKENISIGFKKIEMWDKENYRIDKLWSNYFIRGFKYRDETWGYKDTKGLHLPCIPAYAFLNPIVWNSGIRVKHLAYETEHLRKTKSEFALKNVAVDDEVNYPQLQSIMDPEPKLKKFEQIISSPKVLMGISLSCHYDIEGFLNNLKKIMYNPKKLKVNFYIYKCHPQVFRQLEKFAQGSESEVKVVIQNFKDDFYNKPCTRQVVEMMYNLKGEEGYDFYMGVTHDATISSSTMVDLISTDRDIVFMTGKGYAKGIYMSKEMLNKYSPETFVVENEFNFNTLVEIHGDYLWYTGKGIPVPLKK